MESGICLAGGEIAVVAGILAALVAAISALWFAYSKSMMDQIERLTHELSNYRALVRDALERRQEA